MSTTLINEIQEAFVASNKDFARAYYLFATAKLSETYNSEAIYEKYPLLHAEETFNKLKVLYDQQPNDEETKRLFVSVMGTYIGNKMAKASDEFQNLKNQLKIDVTGLDLKRPDGEVLSELLYEDVSEWLKKIEEKPRRQDLYDRMGKAWSEHLQPKFLELFHEENQMLADLGYADIIDFYSKTTGHPLRKLADKGKELVTQTQDLYTDKMSALYKKKTGLDFSQATRADISFVMHRPTPDMAAIDARFPESRMLPLATETFDGLGLSFSEISQTVDFKTLDEYNQEVVAKTDAPNNSLRRILLDVAKREGKRSRAYVYPSAVPAEIYLSVKPEGGLDDYSAFFHESGHAQHFAYEDPNLSYAMSMLGNNTTTECYAYLMQNLFLNRHWLEHKAGLTTEEAKKVVQRGALNDLYMLRRYGSKMQFEIALYDGVEKPGFTLDGKGKTYAQLLTLGCGYKYDAEGWTRDVDAGFYVADYFTAWSLEAQLREYLCEHFGNKAVHGEDWYANPKAGEFLKSLWKDGNLPQQDLSARIGYNNPNDVGPLVRLMDWNLG